MKNTILASLLIFSVLACKKGVKKTEASNPTQEIVDNTETLTILLSPKSKSIVSGKVEFTETNGNVQMTAMIKGLSEGSHAIHLHEKSDCSSDDGKSSGGHWNPTGQPHGKWGVESGYHKGDIGNFNVKNEGEDG